jgi:5-methyltetrahydropteroyltriglutamate--homocysteine methyltransferase
MFTATQGVLLPATVTGSWPRPAWYRGKLEGRALSDALTDVDYREQFLDAHAVVISDQERAGLDILTNGDYHLDADLGGASWICYPIERVRGVSGRPFSAVPPDRSHAPGTILAELISGWRVPAVTGEVEPGGPLEFAKLWRIAQSKTDRPVKFGTVSTQFAAGMLELRTGRYPPNRRELFWDLATAMNAELRQLAAAGCQVIQIEEPLLHFLAANSGDREYLDFLVECFNHEISGLDNTEVWVHTCWGNANMQRSSESTSYAEAIELFMDRVDADVWTVEMKDRNYGDLELFRPYRGRRDKKIALGVVSHRTLQVETVGEVAEDIHYALNYLDPEQLILTSDCGFGRQGPNRLVAFYKAAAIAEGAAAVRRDLGLESPRPIRAAHPRLQIDVPG